MKFSRVSLLSLVALCAAPAQALDGDLGYQSSGSAQITVVVPAKISLTDAVQSPGSWQSCAQLTPGVELLAQRPDGSRIMLSSDRTHERCKHGERSLELNPASLSGSGNGSGSQVVILEPASSS